MSAVRTRLRRPNALRPARSLLRLGLRLLPVGLPVLPAARLPAGPHPALRGPGGTGHPGAALPHGPTDQDPPRLGEREAPGPRRPGAD